MTDPYPDLDAGDDKGVGPDRGKGTGLAPWQIVVAIIGLLVVLVVVILLFAGNGHTSPVDHGMGLT